MYAILPTLCFLILLLYLPSSGLHWHSFLQKSVQFCHSDDKGGGTINSSGNPKWISVGSGQETNIDYTRNKSLIDLLESSLRCVIDYWSSCVTPQRFPRENLPPRVFIYNKPCYHLYLHLPDYNILFHLQVQKMFQINLTFTYFYLQYFQLQNCPTHQVMVSHFAERYFIYTCGLL